MKTFDRRKRGASVIVFAYVLLIFKKKKGVFIFSFVSVRFFFHVLYGANANDYIYNSFRRDCTVEPTNERSRLEFDGR